MWRQQRRLMCVASPPRLGREAAFCSLFFSPAAPARPLTLALRHPLARQVVKGDYAAFVLVNQSFFYCCCGKDKCPQPQLNMTRNLCWVPQSELYPCDSVHSFAPWIEGYIKGKIEPVAFCAFFLCLLQFFTSVVACCNQCQGKKQQEKDKISGPVSYDGLDGMYGEGEEAYGGGGGKSYESYVGYVKGGGVGGVGRGNNPPGAAQKGGVKPPPTIVQK